MGGGGELWFCAGVCEIRGELDYGGEFRVINCREFRVKICTQISVCGIMEVDELEVVKCAH